MLTGEVAMNSNVDASSPGVSHSARWLLASFAIAAIAASAVYFSRGPVVQAEDPPKANAIAPKEPDAEFFPRLTASEEKILAALEQPTELDFHESPLQTVVDFLKDKHSIGIQLDVKALEDGGMASDTPVTCKVNGVSLRSGLRLLVLQIDLAILVRDELLQITTKEVADAELVTRTYPVADLTPGDKYDGLIETIMNTVARQTWDEVGGPGSLSPVKASRSLVVSQTQEVQDKVLQLLRSLRAARKAGGVEWSAVVQDETTDVYKPIARRQGSSGARSGVVGGGAGGGGVKNSATEKASGKE
jgi:hypothetical protein